MCQWEGSLIKVEPTEGFLNQLKQDAMMAGGAMGLAIGLILGLVLAKWTRD